MDKWWSRNRAHRAAPVFLVLVILFTTVEISLAGEGNVASPADYSAVANALRAMVQRELTDKKIPAISVALVDGQKIVWAEGFGYADPDKKIPATAETVFRVGSVSKLFTDIGVMQLVERGELSLDKPIGAYLPDFHPRNPFGGDITLRELTSHRSGLLREPPVGNYFETTEPSLVATVRSLNDTELVYKPGEHTKYSNAGIAVVGYTLQTKTGEAFAPYLKRAVLDPMGLTSSSFLPEPRLVARLAKAAMWSYDGLNFPAPTFQLGMAPAGCMYSTVTDLGRFAQVLFAEGKGPGGQVITPASLKEMWTPQFAAPREKTGFGIGFRLGDYQGHRVVGHGGAIYGFATSFAAMPDDKLAAIAIGTKDSVNAVTDHIVREALILMLAAKAHQPLPVIAQTQPVPLDRVRKLVGHYGDPEQGVELEEQFGELFLRPSSGSMLRLRQTDNGSSTDLITDDAQGYGMVVKTGENEITFGGKTLQRVVLGKPAPVPEDLQRLVGEYGWDHDKLYVFERNGKLSTLIEWFEFDSLEKQGDHSFAFPQSGLYDGEQAIFTTDDAGGPTQVKVSGVVFPRRPVGAGTDGVFRIKPQQPVAELRKAALAAKPPEEKGEFFKSDLVDLTSFDPTIKLDIRYAGTDNFLSTPVYTEAKAFMQRPAAEAVARANRKLHEKGYGLLIHDAYRPWYVTKIFWDATPAEGKIFVANPAEGSRHNRGCAVDLTLYDLKTGKEVVMTGVYDEMSQRSYAYYPGGTSLERWQRDLLRSVMESESFTVYPWEWWHFDFDDWRKYPIGNQTFEQLSGEKSAAALVIAIPDAKAAHSPI